MTTACCHASSSPPTLIKACATPPAGGGKSAPVSLYQSFAQHGYTQLTWYQPANRFWLFQWIEGGWLLALSILLIAAAVWLVHRRVA